MTTIRIEKINEVHIRVYSEFGVESELADYFTYEYPGAKFTPQFKARLWDGKVRLYDQIRKTLYVGLLDYVLKFAESNDYEIEYVNDVQDQDAIEFDMVEQYADDLQLHARGEPIDIRDYQLDAIHTALINRRNVLLSPTGSGKSLIIYTICRWLLEQGKKILVVVPTTSLVEQMYSDFEDYSSHNGWPADKIVQKIYSGFPKEVAGVRTIFLEDGSRLTMNGSELIKTINRGVVTVRDLDANDDIDPEWVKQHLTK